MNEFFKEDKKNFALDGKQNIEDNPGQIRY